MFPANVWSVWSIVENPRIETTDRELLQELRRCACLLRALLLSLALKEGITLQVQGVCARRCRPLLLAREGPQHCGEARNLRFETPCTRWSLGIRPRKSTWWMQA